MNKQNRWIGAVLAGSLAFGANAMETTSPRLKTLLDYQLGGGLISGPPTQIQTIPILSFGAGWDLNMSCGEFDPKMTVKNQLNGLTDGFKNMMDNVINSATAAVASLPALAIQKPILDSMTFFSRAFCRARWTLNSPNCPVRKWRI